MARKRTPAKHHQTKRTVREEAEFLAREIQDNVIVWEAKAPEVADAIERAIRRYARLPYCLKKG